MQQWSEHLKPEVREVEFAAYRTIYPEGFQSLATIAFELFNRFRDEPDGPSDLILAYREAHEHSSTFETLMAEAAKTLQCEFRCRPGAGVKAAERLLEKARTSGKVPLDLLGGKLIEHSLESMFRTATRIPELFEVVGFKDRIGKPQRSGYRDLQFQVSIEGHIAEVKVVHARMDELDDTEHRIYEIIRSLEAKGDLVSSVETNVIRRLIEASRSLYTETWQRILIEEAR